MKKKSKMKKLSKKELKKVKGGRSQINSADLRVKFEQAGFDQLGGLPYKSKVNID